MIQKVARASEGERGRGQRFKRVNVATSLESSSCLRHVLLAQLYVAGEMTSFAISQHEILRFFRATGSVTH